MKILKKIVLTILVIIVLASVAGYVYFDKKFTPAENYLTVSNHGENIPLKWVADGNNPHAALLLPVKIQGIKGEFFMQLDFGSPTTLFYKNSLESIDNELKNLIQFHKDSTHINLNFSIKDLTISSENFGLIKYGKKIDFDNPKAENIIGTIGTDLLEKRIIVLDFRNNLCAFVTSIDEKGFAKFQFKKRRILIPAKLENEDLKLLYDSGTSGYQLITDEKTWNEIKIPNAKIKTEKGNSWGNELKVVSAPTHKELEIGNTSLPLSEVTHISGTSKMQNLLIKSSGMNGMIGNKIFLNRKIIIDCKNEKFKIE